MTNGGELTEELMDNSTSYVIYNQLASLTTDSKFTGFRVLLEKLKEIEYNLIKGYPRNNNKKEVFDDITNYNLDRAFIVNHVISLEDISPRFLTAHEIKEESRTNNVIIPSRRNTNTLKIVSGKTTLSNTKNRAAGRTKASKRWLSRARNSVTRKRNPTSKKYLRITSQNTFL